MREQASQFERGDEIIERLESRLPQSDFWQHQGLGLAIFATSERMWMLRLPTEVEESAEVGPVPMIAPLLPMVSQSKSFLLLTLTWEKASLFRVDDSEAVEITTDSLPATYDQLILPRDPETQLQYTTHQQGRGGTGNDTAMYHGQGNGEDKIEGDRRNYLLRVGEIVNEEVYGRKLPLYLVATSEVGGEFQTLADVDVQHQITASPSQMELKKLVAKVTPLLDSQFEQRMNRLNEQFGTAKCAVSGIKRFERNQGSGNSGTGRDFIALATHWQHLPIASNERGSNRMFEDCRGYYRCP